MDKEKVSMAEAIMELDIELVTLLLRKYLKVHRLDEAQAALDLPTNQMLQFDEYYAVEFIRYDNVLPLIQDFLEEVFERGRLAHRRALPRRRARAGGCRSGPRGTRVR